MLDGRLGFTAVSSAAFSSWSVTAGLAAAETGSAAVAFLRTALSGTRFFLFSLPSFYYYVEIECRLF